MVLSSTVSDREAFLRDHVPSRIQLHLESPYGKDNLSQCFLLESSFRLVLLPLFRSGFLGDGDWHRLCDVNVYAFLVTSLLLKYAGVDFRPLRSFPPNWESETTVDESRVWMMTSAALFYDGDLASVVRFLGGPYTGAHRSFESVSAKLGGTTAVPALKHLRRAWNDGCPAFCNATSSERNFQAFRHYGNHKTVTACPEKTYKGLVKDHKRGFVIAMEPGLVHFVLNCHLTPQGIVDLDHPFKQPRPIFDSSFRPDHWCEAINDWTDKSTEPELFFAKSFMTFLQWVYWLRITYPFLEIYIADDDVCGAFRQLKYHPNLVALHCFMIEGLLVASLGLTFGDNTSPSNFEPVATCRVARARQLWHDPAVVERAAQFIPPVQFAPNPTPAEVADFVRADSDTQNSGVLDDNGDRLPPAYAMHVDDNMMADVRGFLPQTVAASVMALYDILGPPGSGGTVDVLSRDKLRTFYSHLRKVTGYIVDSRLLRVSLPDYKREQLAALLLDWQSESTFTLLKAAELYGSLQSATRFYRWGRVQFLIFQSVIGEALRTRHGYLLRRYPDFARRRQFARALPPRLADRLEPLIQRDKAKQLWQSEAPIPLTNTLRQELQFLRDAVVDPEHSWSMQIGHIIPRDPHVQCWGDACLDGGGAFCMTMRWWFDVTWPAHIVARTELDPRHPDHVHINALEFAVIIWQFAATSVAFLEYPTEELRAAFPNGIPAEPILRVWCDNVSAQSWANRLSSGSRQARNLLKLFGELLLASPLGVVSERVETAANGLADFLSRPSRRMSRSHRLAQIYHRAPFLRSWQYFQPSPYLMSAILGALSSASIAARPEMPKPLGRFVPAGSIF